MHNAIRAIIEVGNCVYCGKHIDGGGHIFLYKECRRKEEEGCLHEKPKAAGTGTAGPERPITAREPKQRPTGREER